MNKWKPLSKFLGIWTFLLLFLLKEAVPQPAVAQSSLACARSKECLTLLAESTVKAVRVANTAIKITTLVTNITAHGNATVNDWTDAQTLMAQERSWQRYCATNSKDIVCAGRMPGVRYRIIADFYYEYPTRGILNNRWITVFEPATIHFDSNNNSGAYQPYGLVNAIRFKTTLQSQYGNIYQDTYDPKPAENYLCNLIVSWGNPPRLQEYSPFGSWVQPGQPPKIQNLQVFPADGRPDTGGVLPWKDWDQEKRDAAIELLTDSDWQEIANTMPFVGVRSPGDTIEAPNGEIIVNHEPATNAPNGSQPWAERVPNSYTFPSTSNPSDGDADNLTPDDSSDSSNDSGVDDESQPSTANLERNVKTIAKKLDRSVEEINDAIHAVKRDAPELRAGTRKNPDVQVDVETGDVYPEIQKGKVVSDPIGNIFDYLR